MSSLEATLNRVERLASSGSVEDVRALVELLGDEDWQARRAAADAIARAVYSQPQETVTQPLFEELIAAVCDKTHAGKRAASAAALEGIGQRALPRLAAELQTANPSARIALAGVVGNAGGAEAVRLLAPLARDADTNVAAAAITALGRTRAPEAAPVLLERLKAEDDWLRFAAVGALGELGDARAITELELLLEEPLLQEAAAAALVELGTVEAATALAGHLRDPEGALRVAVLAGLISLEAEEGAMPLVVAEAIRATARRAFLTASDEATYSDLLRLMAKSELGRTSVFLTALGWLGDVRAVPLITNALAEPTLSATARKALVVLSTAPEALSAMLNGEAIPATELAMILGGAKSLAAIEAAARLSVEARDAETLELSLTALAQGREWLRRVQHNSQLSEADATRLAESLRKVMLGASGRALPEIARTLGVLAPSLPATTIDALIEQLSRTDAEDLVLARLSLLQRADAARAFEEATRAQHHRSAWARIAAIEILSRRAGATPSGLIQHLTDEAAGVRRATVRALRGSAPTPEIMRSLVACLADEDIWVRAEAVTTLGQLFGSEPGIHLRLREALRAAHPLCRVAACNALATHPETQDWGALSELARRDSQAEVRRAAVQAFVRGKQSRTALAVARRALSDSEWSVRRAGVEVLASVPEAVALKLLLGVAGSSAEEATVRGAALRSLAYRDAPEVIQLACHALGSHDAQLFEDAYTALATLARTRRREMQQQSARCAPRAANVINFILKKSDE